MVAGQDINFDMIHALGKEKEVGQKEGKEVEERDEEPDQRPRSMSVGASRCFQLVLKTITNVYWQLESETEEEE